MLAQAYEAQAGDVNAYALVLAVVVLAFLAYVFTYLWQSRGQVADSHRRLAERAADPVVVGFQSWDAGDDLPLFHSSRPSHAADVGPVVWEGRPDSTPVAASSPGGDRVRLPHSRPEHLEAPCRRLSI